MRPSFAVVKLEEPGDALVPAIDTDFSHIAAGRMVATRTLILRQPFGEAALLSGRLAWK